MPLYSTSALFAEGGSVPIRGVIKSCEDDYGDIEIRDLAN
jgi:hypothetical protein